MTLEEQLKQALAELCRQQGTVEAVADKAEVSADNLKQILAGTKLPSGQPRGIGPTVRRKLEAAFPGWTTLSSQAAGSVKSSPLQAQSVSLDKFTVPQTLAWGELMTVDLPEVFNVVLTDNSMAPRAPVGARVEFTRGLKPAAGDGILVRDAKGNHYFRVYREGPADTWKAAALNQELEPMDAAAWGLEVVAVLTGMAARWAI